MASIGCQRVSLVKYDGSTERGVRQLGGVDAVYMQYVLLHTHTLLEIQSTQNPPLHSYIDPLDIPSPPANQILQLAMLAIGEFAVIDRIVFGL